MFLLTMAVQKSRCSRAKRNRRCSQKKFKIPELSCDFFSNEIHKRHSISLNGYYKGRKILKVFKKMNKNNS